MLERILGTDIGETGRRVAAVTEENQVTVLSAGLAYHAFNSLIPAAILAVLALSQFDGFGLLAELVTGFSGTEMVQVLETARRVTRQASGRLRAFVIAGLVLLWSSGRLFEAVQQTFTELYDGDEYDSTVEQVRDILLASSSLLLGALLMLALGVWLVYITSGWMSRFVAPAVMIVVLALVFLPMYYLFPRVEISLREALPGALFAAAVWVVSAIGVSLYASVSKSVQLYGAAGGVLLFLTWIYLGALALPVGAILNVVVSDDQYGAEALDTE